MRLFGFLSFLFLLQVQLFCQERTIFGRIYEESNEPLPGVVVSLMGEDSVRTVSDIDGVFKLIIPKGSVTLVFSSVGMKRQEVEVVDENEFRIVMKVDCHKDYFDGSQSGVFFTSGTSYGDGFSIESSHYISVGTLIGRFEFMGFHDQRFSREGQVELRHIISNCDYDLAMEISLRELSISENQFRYVDMNAEHELNKFNLLTGLSRGNISDPLFGSGQLTGLRLGVNDEYWIRHVGSFRPYFETSIYIVDGFVRGSGLFSRTNVGIDYGFKGFELGGEYENIQGFDSFNLRVGYRFYRPKFLR